MPSGGRDSLGTVAHEGGCEVCPCRGLCIYNTCFRKYANDGRQVIPHSSSKATGVKSLSREGRSSGSRNTGLRFQSRGTYGTTVASLRPPGCQLCLPWPRDALETRSLGAGHSLYGRGAVQPGKNTESHSVARGPRRGAAAGPGRGWSSSQQRERFLAVLRGLRPTRMNTHVEKHRCVVRARARSQTTRASACRPLRRSWASCS